MPRSEERGGMAAHSEAEANSLLVYKSPAWKGGVLYSLRFSLLRADALIYDNANLTALYMTMTSTACATIVM